MKKMLIYAGVEIAIGLGMVLYAEISAKITARKVEKEYRKWLVKCQKDAISKAEEILKYKKN